jgi:glycosyltransferase involved in cell wall biosynthesis
LVENTLKIIVNAVGYVGQSGGAGGAGVFLQYLIGELSQHHSVDVLVAQNSRSFRGQPRGARFIELPYVTGDTLRHLRDGPTVVLDPFGALPCTPFPGDMALCVVVHDLMHLERPYFFTESERADRSLSFAGGLQRADAVVTFSSDQARAIRRFYPGAIPVVIPHLPYASLKERAATAPEGDLGAYKSFLLFPAVKWPHKNHRTVIEAFGAYVRRAGSELRLLLCGGPCAEGRFSYYPPEQAISNQVTDLGLVGDALLAGLFDTATAIVMPTLYEGFGIPVLEAAYQGKMVIASKLDVFDEILGPTGYRAVVEPLCQLRWMDAFADAAGPVRVDYEARARQVREKVDPGRYLKQFTDVLRGAADRYSHPSLYPGRGFRSGDRATSSVVAELTFADIHGTAAVERGARQPALGDSPATRSSTVFRGPEAAPERRLCLRAQYDEQGWNAAGATPLVFHAWVRLLGEPRVDSIRWSVNDGDIVDLLPELRDGEWHLLRRAVPAAGFIDFRATRGDASEAVGFDIEIHNPCLLRVEPMAVPVASRTAAVLNIYVAAVAESIKLGAVVAAIAAVNHALPLAADKLHWVIVATSAVVGDETGQDLPANVRVQIAATEPVDRAAVAGLASPYQPFDQLLLLDANDLGGCLESDNRERLAAAVGPARAAAARTLSLDLTLPSLWLEEERGRIIDVSLRTGQPVPLLDREVIQACLAAKTVKSRPRFAVIETDLVGGISHHSVVTGLFLDGAEACGFQPVLGLNRAATPSEQDDIEVWAGFRPQVYRPGTADEFAQDLDAFTRAKKLGPDDVVFMHSISPQIVLGAARFVAARAEHSPRIAMRFFSSSEAMAGHKLSYSKILRSIEAVQAVRNRMHFFCESENLIKYYEDAVGRRFPLLFNPEHPALATVRRSTWFDPGLGGGQQRSLAYFGEARAEKGFDYIPGILEALIADPVMDGFHFIIQTGSNSMNQTPEMARAKASLFALKAKHRGRIRTFESAETPEEFYFLMKHVQGVISPYRPEAYGVRGSGVTLEALQMGLDVFAWADTDLYATFQGTGHLVGVASTEDFAEVIARHYATPASEPRNGVDSLRQPPAAVCERLLSLCASAAHTDARTAPPVLWVGNDTFGEGCSAVYASQKRALREIGRDCLELFVPWPDRNWRGVEPGAYDAKIYGFDSQYEGTGLAWMARPNFSVDLDRILDAVESSGPTYARLRDLNKHMIVPESLRRALAAHSVDQTLLNYAHLYPVIEGTMPLDRIVCETHDIVAYQHAVRRGGPVSLTEKIDEFSDLAQFPSIVAISASEQGEIASACPGSEVFWRLPPYIPEVSNASGFAGIDDLAEFDGVPEAVARPTPVMLSVYQSRPDLQETFPLNGLSGRAGFFRWWVFYGQFEYGDRFGLARRQYEWLVGPPVKKRVVPALSGLLTLMLSARDDLRATFTTADGIDVPALESWAAANAEREFGLSRESLVAKGERMFAGRTQFDDPKNVSALDAVIEAQPTGLGGGTPAEHQALFERISDIGTIDLVMVGSGHPANVGSFEWFISTVYLPHLARSGHSLFIVGSVCSSLTRHIHRNLILLGRCQLIEPMLKASRACPLPVVFGSGSPIKTIPAMAVNGAITVTEHIDRAFGLADYGIPSFSDPKPFADDLRMLLTDEVRRNDRIQAARRYVDEVLSVAGYVQFWRDRLNGAG